MIHQPSGIRAARQLRPDQPTARIIFLTVHDEPAFLAEARKIGALGYVNKQSADSDLIPAIREALQGRSFVSPSARQGSFSRKPSKEFPAKLETFRVIGSLADQ